MLFAILAAFLAVLVALLPSAAIVTGSKFSRVP